MIKKTWFLWINCPYVSIFELVKIQTCLTNDSLNLNQTSMTAIKLFILIKIIKCDQTDWLLWTIGSLNDSLNLNQTGWLPFMENIKMWLKRLKKMTLMNRFLSAIIWIKLTNDSPNLNQDSLTDWIKHWFLWTNDSYGVILEKDLSEKRLTFLMTAIKVILIKRKALKSDLFNMQLWDWNTFRV